MCPCISEDISEDISILVLGDGLHVWEGDKPATNLFELLVFDYHNCII